MAVDITNVGERAGVEIVQLYLRDLVASIKRPMRQLKAFERVGLEPGEKQAVTFTLTPQQLAFWNARGERVVEPGDFTVMVGGDATSTRDATFRVES